MKKIILGAGLLVLASTSFAIGGNISSSATANASTGMNDNLMDGFNDLVKEIETTKTKTTCPLNFPDPIALCGKEGKVIVTKKDKNGCAIKYGCEKKAAKEVTFCTREYMPVCGENDNNEITYSNSCEAKKAGAEIKYKGKCKDEEKFKAKKNDFHRLPPMPNLDMKIDINADNQETHTDIKATMNLRKDKNGEIKNTIILDGDVNSDIKTNSDSKKENSLG